MAYDSDRGVTVFFGGAFSEIADEEIFFQDTWEYDGVRWRKMENIIASDGLPEHRANHSMCYDPVRRQVVLTGGRNERDWFADTWVYSREGNSQGIWQRRPPHGEPSVAYSAMVFDVSRGLAVLTGGLPGTEDPDSVWEVWEWNGSQWNSGLRLPGDRSHHAAAYDSLRGFIRLQGGQDVDSIGFDTQYADLLTFLNGWVSTEPPLEQAANHSRVEHAMVYDSNRDRLVLFGGANQASPLHVEYSTTQGWRAMPINTPAGRAQPAMVFDSGRGVTVLFGGVGGTRYDDTWELRSIQPGVQLWDAQLQQACEFTDITFRATVTAPTGSTLQWLHDGQAVSGGSEAFLTLRSVDPFDAGQYSLRVTDPCGNVYVSPAYSFVVHTRPRITAFDARRKNLCPGESATLTVEASSTLPMRYLWRKNGQVIPGEANSLTLTNLQHGDTGSYQVMVRNDCGETSSQSTHLQVGVTIQVQPQNATGPVCGATNFLVVADGVGTLRYQWRLDGAKLSNDDHFAGANSALLEISPLLYAHEGKYDIVITDDCGPVHSVTSRVATLTVTPGPQWFFRTTNGPPGRYGHTLTYDSHRGVTVLFGGVRIPSYQAFDMLNDLWEWDGARWLQRLNNSTNQGWTNINFRWQPSFKDGPVARYGHAMAYDSARGRLVMFGGQTRTPDGSQVFLKDLWEWDGATWHFRGTNGPPMRTESVMAYEPSRGRTVVFGGSAFSFDPLLNLVWEWDGQQWHTNRATFPSTYGQTIGSMVYDSFRKAILFGPSVSPEVATRFWDWTGTGWIPLPAIETDVEILKLNRTENAAMAYDSYRRRAVRFGGIFGAVENRTGFFDGSEWKLLADPVRPAPRTEAAMAYDSRRHAMVMFGGDLAGYSPNPWFPQMTNDTWELIALDTPLVNEQPASQYRRPGEPAVFRVSAVGPGTLSYQWYRDGLPLTAERRRSGVNTPALTVSALQADDAGMHRVLIRNDCGQAWSLPAILSLRPDLQIFTTQNTTTLLWSDPQVVLEQSETIGGPWTPVPGATSPFNPAALGPAKFYRLRTN
jgi:hypothetical protein